MVFSALGIIRFSKETCVIQVAIRVILQQVLCKERVVRLTNIARREKVLSVVRTGIMTDRYQTFIVKRGPACIVRPV